MGLREQLQPLAGSRRIAMTAFDAGHDVELPGEALASPGDLLLEMCQAPLQSRPIGTGVAEWFGRRQLAQHVDRPAVLAGMIRHEWRRRHK